MELDGSGQFGVGFGWICQNLMAREQCERDLGGFCLGSVAHHWTIFIGLTAGKRHSLFVTASFCPCCKLLFRTGSADRCARIQRSVSSCNLPYLEYSG